MANVFSSVTPANVPRGKFDLSHEVKLDCDMGQLIPVGCWECLPNDYFKISAECVIRTIPLRTPVLQEMNAYVHYFFVPYRILMENQDDWTTFFTLGKDGLETPPNLPKWNPTSSSSRGANGMPSGSARYSLWDYLGFPIGITNLNANGAPLSFPKRAYNECWNWFYRDENLQDEIDWDTDTIQFRNVQKDYFTSSLPWIVKGAMPSIPLTGQIPVQYWNNASIKSGLPNSVAFLGSGIPSYSKTDTGSTASTIGATGGANTTVKNLYVDVANSTTIKIDDLRNLLAQERWLQRNAVGGTRLDEFLIAHYGIAPSSEVLDRPQYIGGVKMPVMVSEVAQTSASSGNSPQGTLSGNGLVASNQYVGDYKCKEHGLIIGILSVLPTQSYFQGINRAWLKNDRFDFYFPEFANLDPQPIWNQEIYASNTGTFNSADIFGYQGRFDELRYIPSRVCGGFASDPSRGVDGWYMSWHLARRFNSKPSLNSEFVSAKYYSTQDGKRIFSVQEDDFDPEIEDAERTLLVNFRNVVSAVRPLPYMSI